MRCSYSWLREFVDFDLSPEQLAQHLTMLGLEVDSVEKREYDVSSAAIAEVLEVGETEITATDGSAAFNVKRKGFPFKKGDRIVLIPVSENGEWELASYQRLGLSDAEEPILGDPNWEKGTRLSHYIPKIDWIFEIDLTPNRPDCLSILGIAREISASLDVPLRKPKIYVKETDPPTSELVVVEIEAPEGCPRYAARLLRNVEIRPSPAWIHWRLWQVGIRAINNIVDVTNYVMVETGHPLHAFDFSLIEKGKIVVRFSRHGERFVTLDGKGHTLDDRTVLICDGVRPVAIGGIMGGLNSEVRLSTRDVLIECAYFDPKFIRRSASRLGFSTESSMRFSRGVDPNDTVQVINRTAQLMNELAGGTLLKGVVDAYPRPIRPAQVLLRHERVEKILGRPVAVEDVRDLLHRLECGVEPENGEQQGAGRFRVTVPTFRPDLTREIDLIEEIARLIGYDTIPEKMDSHLTFTAEVNRKERFLREIRRFFVGRGLSEAVSNSMVSSSDPILQAFPGATLRLMNPLSEEMAVLRPSLIPSMVRLAQYNLFRQHESVFLFEIGKTFFVEEGAHREELHLAGVLVGATAPEHWKHKPREVDFFDLKGLVEAFFRSIHTDVTFAPCQKHWAVEEPVLEVISNGRQVGILGKLREHFKRSYDLPADCYIFELNLEEILSIISWQRQFEPVPRFPWVRRDLAFVVDLQLPGERLVEEIKKWGGTILRDVNIFDVYMGQQVPRGKKSIAVALRYQHHERTLSDEEIQQSIQDILKGVKETLGAELRT
jgi:phenylalanyl-tRNA synthetase beta chain